MGRGAVRGAWDIHHNQAPFVERSYVDRARVSVNMRLAPRAWGGRPYYAYHHDGRFGDHFWRGVWLGWQPWRWEWTWLAAPWFVAWSWYWQPYPPVYASADAWLSDWVMSDMLNDAYNRGLAEGMTASNQPSSAPITESQREQLRRQVGQTAQSFQTEQTIDLREALASQPNYLFAANQTVNFVPPGSSQACRVTEGDLLQIVSPPTDQNPTATMTIVASKFGDCAAGTQVFVSVSDLQEMLNSFAERVDRGLHSLEQSHGGPPQ